MKVRDRPSETCNSYSVPMFRHIKENLMSNVMVNAQSSSSNVMLAGDYDIVISKDLNIRWHNIGASRVNVIALATTMASILSNKEKVSELAGAVTGLLNLPKDEDISLRENDMYHAKVHVEVSSDLTFDITGVSRGNVDVISLAKFLAQVGKELQATLLA